MADKPSGPIAFVTSNMERWLKTVLGKISWNEKALAELDTEGSVKQLALQ